MFDEGPPPTEPYDSTCYRAHGQFINRTGDYTQVIRGFATDSIGKIWAVQNFH